MLKLKHKQATTTQKYYSKIIKSYQSNNETFGRKNRDLLAPEAIQLDTDDFAHE